MAPLLNPRKVLITDKIDEVCKSVLQQHGLEVTLKPGMPKEDLLKEIKVCLGPLGAIQEKSYVMKKLNSTHACVPFCFSCYPG